MPLDHFVSQVHLRNFYSPVLGGRMYGIRKRDLHSFPCRSEDVCRTRDGSTNDFLLEPRVVEEFLKVIEPKYNASVEKLRTGAIDYECVFVIAGFIAYVVTCSPAAMRINAGPLRGAVEVTAKILDKRGDMPKAPAELGNKPLSELLSDGSVGFDIDGKYPQAIGITIIMRHVANFGNFSWDILHNDEPGSPYFTSDFPVAIETTSDPRVLNRIVPLAPDLAIRIRPDINCKNVESLDFPEFSTRRCEIRGKAVHAINRLIVQSAETLVFYRDDAPWVRKFVARHHRYLIEPKVRQVPTSKGYLVWSRLELEELTR
jgi:hypothetical protein